MLAHVPHVLAAHSVLLAANPVLVQAVNSERTASQIVDSAESVSGNTVSADQALTDNVLCSLSDAALQQSLLTDDPIEHRFVKRDNSLFVLPQKIGEIYAAVQVEVVEQPHAPPPMLPSVSTCVESSKQKKNKS